MKGHKDQTSWAYLTFVLHRNDYDIYMLKDESTKINLNGI